MSNTIHISKIEQGLEQVKELGHSSDTFEVCGHTIGVRTLSRPQLREINLYCKPYLEDAQEQDTTFAMTDWMQKVREETLAHAIVQINDVDFRGVDFIQMEDENGEVIKKQKHVIVREILQNWANTTLSMVYDKYREVVEKADENLQESINLETDEGKISRIRSLQKKIDHLKLKVPDDLLRENGLLDDDAPEDSNDQVKESGTSPVDKEALKQQMYSPTEEGEVDVQLGEVAPRPGENEAQQLSEAQQEYQREQEELHQQQQGTAPEVDPNELTYVDEFGNPLTGDQLEAAKAQDEMLTRRHQQRQEAEAQTKKRRQRPQSRRQPLNTVDANIKNQQSKTVRSNKSDRPGKDEIVSSFDDEPAPLRRSRQSGGPDWRDVADPSPSSQQNPEFQPPSKNETD